MASTTPASAYRTAFTVLLKVSFLIAATSDWTSQRLGGRNRCLSATIELEKINPHEINK
jgi:hypothetical protein